MWRNHAWSCSTVASDLAAARGDLWTHFSLGGVGRLALAHLKGNNSSLMCLCNGGKAGIPHRKDSTICFPNAHTEKVMCASPWSRLPSGSRTWVTGASPGHMLWKGWHSFVPGEETVWPTVWGRGRRSGQKEQIQAMSLAAAPRILRVNKMQLTECLFRGYIFMTKISGSEMYSFPWLSGWLFSIQNSSVRFPKLDKSLRLIVSGM